MTTQKRKLLILIENESQCSEYIKYKGEFASFEHIIYALTPFAIRVCEKNNLSFFLPEDCFSEEDYYVCKTISEDKIKELVSLLNQYYSGISQEDIGFPLEMGNYFYFQLYVTLGALHYRAFLLTKVIGKENPEQIIVFRLKQTLPLFLEFRFNPLGNLYSDLLLNSVYKDKCKFIEYGNAEKKFKKKTISKDRIKEAIKSIIVNFPVLYQYYFFWRQGIHFSLIKKLSGRYKNNILLLGSAYNWKDVFNHPKIKSDIYIAWIPGEKILKPKNKKKKDIFKELLWENKFLEFNLSYLMYDQMEIVELTFIKMLKSFSKTRKILRKFDMVITSALCFPEQNYVAHIARSIGKPVVVYQHGGKNYHNDDLFSETTEMLYADYYLSYGEGVNSTYSKNIGKYKNFKGPVSIGSSAFDTLASQKTGTDNKYILYATGKYLLNSGPFASDSIGADIKLYQSQRKIISYLEHLATQQPPYNIIWKLNNTPLLSDISIEASHVAQVHFEKTFTDLINDASLIILDAPGNTCFEVCSTKKPLFTIHNRTKWFPEVVELLKKRVVVTFTPDELIEKIDDYLKTGIYQADINNREFINAYGTYLDDGKSVDRAVNFIFSLMKN